jgi:hypothetical protein
MQDAGVRAVSVLWWPVKMRDGLSTAHMDGDQPAGSAAAVVLPFVYIVRRKPSPQISAELPVWS